MDPKIQLIKDYFTGGGVRGQVDGNRVSLDGVILGEYDPVSREIRMSKRSPVDNLEALESYTLLQLMGMTIFRGLRDSARVRLGQVLQTTDERRINDVFVSAYADYAVYRGEFGLVENEELTSFMQDLFDEEKMKELTDW